MSGIFERTSVFLLWIFALTNFTDAETTRFCTCVLCLLLPTGAGLFVSLLIGIAAEASVFDFDLVVIAMMNLDFAVFTFLLFL